MGGHPAVAPVALKPIFPPEAVQGSLISWFLSSQQCFMKVQNDLPVPLEGPVYIPRFFSVALMRVILRTYKILNGSV